VSLSAAVLPVPSHVPAPLDGLGGGPCTPAQIAHAYGFDRLVFANSGVPPDGRGQTIAIVDAHDDPNIAGDLHNFDVAFGLPDPALTVARQTVNGRPVGVDATGAWEMEEALDVEWAHAVAPGANILLVEADPTGLFGCVQWAAAQPGVSVVSMSFGRAESASERSLDSVFTTLAGHPGVTFVASSGDQGTIAYPAASPNVLAVGGTSLALDGAGNYLAENAWSGGGVSAYEGEPGYQRGVQGTGMRTSTDVAYNADPHTGFYVYNSFSGQGPWLAVGGTSAGAPQWSALIALADQGRALAGQGPLDGPGQTLPLIYSLPASAFHDITGGGNRVAQAGPGYDLATGRGSPFADRVVSALSGQPVAHRTSGQSSSGPSQPPSQPQPPGPQPPGGSAPAPRDPFREVADDALLLARGLKSGDLSAVLAPLADFQALLSRSAAAQQLALEQAFINDLFADLR
jgi:hypothetical protein